MHGLRAVLLLSLGVACNGQAQPRVVETHGDGGDTTCLAAADEVLWIGTRGAGMFRMTPEGSTRYDSTTGLHGNRVHDCLLSGGALWVATEDALSRLDPETDRFVTVSEGRFTRLAESPRGLWASGSDGGVVRIDFDAHDASAPSDSSPEPSASEREGAPPGSATTTAGIRHPTVPSEPLASDLRVSALSSAPDGRWAAGGFDGRVYLGDQQRYLSLRPGGVAASEPIEWLELDEDGLLIGTGSGAYRFDGTSLAASQRDSGRRAGALAGATAEQRAQLRSLQVRDARRFGAALAVATDDGLLLLEGESTRTPQLGEMACGERITALAVHDGALWAGSFDRGLCRYDGATWAHVAGPEHLPSDMINDLVSDGERLLVATAGGVAWLGPDGRFEQRTQRDCRGQLGRVGADCPFHGAVNGVAFDAERGRAWVADLGAVHRADGARWRHYYRSAGIESRALTRIAARGGVVAVGTGDRGLYLKDGKRFEAIDDQLGLADNWVMDLAFDDGGALWIATCTQGLSVRAPDGALRAVRASEGLADDYTLSVRPIDGRVFVGTLRGLSVVEADGAIRSLGTADGLSGHEVHDAVAYAGRVWVATDAGLSVLQ